MSKYLLAILTGVVVGAGWYVDKYYVDDQERRVLALEAQIAADVARSEAFTITTAALRESNDNLTYIVETFAERRAELFKEVTQLRTENKQLVSQNGYLNNNVTNLRNQLKDLAAAQQAAAIEAALERERNRYE